MLRPQVMGAANDARITLDEHLRTLGILTHTMGDVDEQAKSMLDPEEVFEIIMPIEASDLDFAESDGHLGKEEMTIGGYLNWSVQVRTGAGTGPPREYGRTKWRG